MDSITQAALGAVVGEAVMGRQLGWRAAAWGLLFGTLPDLDVFFSGFFDQVGQLKWHRGISHSLLLIFLSPLLFAKPLSALHRKRGLNTTRAAVFVFLAWSTHVLIDVFTTYGTQIFEPFSDRRVSLNNMFIIDLFFTIPMLLSLLLIFFWKPQSKTRRRINNTALTLSTLYVAFSFTMKAWATSQLNHRVATKHPTAQLVATSPTVSNVLLWRGLYETPTHYHSSLISPFDKTPAPVNSFPKHHHLLEELLETKEGARNLAGQALIDGATWFTRDHWIARKNPDNDFILIDMRYTALPNFETGTLSPTFHWIFKTDPQGKLTMQGLRPKTDFKKALKLIYERLKGNQSEWNSFQAF